MRQVCEYQFKGITFTLPSTLNEGGTWSTGNGTSINVEAGWLNDVLPVAQQIGLTLSQQELYAATGLTPPDDPP